MNLIKKLLLNISFSIHSNLLNRKSSNSKSQLENDKNNDESKNEGNLNHACNSNLFKDGLEDFNRIFSIVKFIFPTSYSTEITYSSEKILSDYNNTEINQEYWTNYLVENDLIKMLETPVNGRCLSKEEKGAFLKSYLDSLL